MRMRGQMSGDRACPFPRARVGCLRPGAGHRPRTREGVPVAGRLHGRRVKRAVSAAGGDDSGFLQHEYGAARGDDGAVEQACGDAEAVTGTEDDGVLPVEFDVELAVEDEKELVLLVVLVPVELAVHDA